MKESPQPQSPADLEKKFSMLDVLTFVDGYKFYSRITQEYPVLTFEEYVRRVVSDQERVRERLFKEGRIS